LTSTEIQKLIFQHKTPTITASRLSGNRYGVAGHYANGDYAGPVFLPENDLALLFDVLDEVAPFLSHVGTKQFQVGIWGVP